MINYIQIQNIGIIDNITLELYKGFNVLTGETGAGKTLIVTSLDYITGATFPKDKIRNGADFASVTVVLDINGKEVVVKRKTTKDGKNLCTIDDEVVTKKALADFMKKVIDIHGQKDTPSILQKENMITILDNFCGKDQLKDKSEYQSLYADWKNVLEQIQQLVTDDENYKRELDILDYQIDEIESAKLKKDEYEEIESQLKDAIAFEKMAHHYDSLSTSFSSGLSKIKDSIRTLEQIQEKQDALEQEYNIMENAYYELEEVKFAIDKKIQDYDIDNLEWKIQKLEDRVDIYNTIFAKYGDTYEKVMAFLEKAKQRKQTLENKDVIFANLDQKRKDILDKMEVLAKALSKRRKEYAKILTEQIQAELLDLEMKNASFLCSVEKVDEYNINGKDDVTFMISTNKGSKIANISKVASGGEISRIMLAIKKVVANQDNIQIMVFDEIDTGISGNVGLKVGKKILQIAKEKQVICVTHLATIAALGDVNIHVGKTEKDGQTITVVSRLTDEEKLDEIAKIASGKVTKTSLLHAKELIDEKNNL